MPLTALALLGGAIAVVTVLVLWLDRRGRVAPSDLEPEFHRVGTSWEAFRQVSNRNLPLSHAATPPGAAVNMEIDLPRALRVLRALPDGAGTEAFVQALIKDLEGGSGPRPKGPAGRAAA